MRLSRAARQRGDRRALRPSALAEAPVLKQSVVYRAPESRGQVRADLGLERDPAAPYFREEHVRGEERDLEGESKKKISCHNLSAGEESLRRRVRRAAITNLALLGGQELQGDLPSPLSVCKTVQPGIRFTLERNVPICHERHDNLRNLMGEGAVTACRMVNRQGYRQRRHRRNTSPTRKIVQQYCYGRCEGSHGTEWDP